MTKLKLVKQKDVQPDPPVAEAETEVKEPQLSSAEKRSQKRLNQQAARRAAWDNLFKQEGN